MTIWKFGAKYVDTKLMIDNSIGYAYGDSMPTYVSKNKIKKINIGDIIILAKGQKNKVLAIGVAKSLPFYCNIDNKNIDFSGIHESTNVNLIKEFTNRNNYDVIYISVNWLKVDTSELKISYKYHGFTKLNTDTEIIKHFYLKYKTMKEYITLIESNKNIVLTGAPGTGKTYLAKKIAENMTGSKLDETNEQYAFVQFHPSYDYTDFVEGLRPIKKEEDKELGFELKNGIFKEFCKKAKDDPKPKDNKYVFVIDEINRAEISKVFGELFFAIDPDYRGEKGKVKTQYANMQTEETRFNDNDDYFYVPDNVYIIGTMNDIDRSVESFDFAMRRRFAWKEITADERIEMLYKKLDSELAEKAKTRMKNLNKVIFDKAKGEGIDGLNDSYHIGPAYFLKLINYKDDESPWEKLWKNHLEVLLREYLRGMPDAETKLSDLYEAYNK